MCREHLLVIMVVHIHCSFLLIAPRGHEIKQTSSYVLSSLSQDGLCFIWHNRYHFTIACLALILQTVAGVFWYFSFISDDDLLNSDLFLPLLAFNFLCDVRETSYSTQQDLISYLLGSSSYQLNVITFVAFVFCWGGSETVVLPLQKYLQHLL